MILTSSQAGLAQLIEVPQLIAQIWPTACGDVQMLIHLLRLLAPTLAGVLAAPDLVSMLVPVAGRSTSLISLAYGDVVITGTARDKAGDTVADPNGQASLVCELEVTDLVAAGRSGLGLAV